MKDYRKNEIGKKRHEQLKVSEVRNGAVIGMATLWLIWFSTSVLLFLAG